jgi:hypothetical protein
MGFPCTQTNADIYIYRYIYRHWGGRLYMLEIQDYHFVIHDYHDDQKLSVDPCVTVQKYQNY